MNERIKQIAEKATINIGDEFHPIDFFDKEKFAELLVLECADVAFAKASSDESACDLSIAIKEHFGVEE